MSLQQPSTTPNVLKHQTAQIFISYSRSDRLAVDQLFGDLHKHHYILWLDVDEHGIEPGEKWQQELVKQVSASEAVIACVSPDFLRSKFCRAEIEQAKRENKPIFPVIMRRLDKDQSLADVGLDHLQFVDLTMGYDDGLKRLMNVLPRPTFQLKVWLERFGVLVASAGALLLLLLIAVFGSALATTITTPTITPVPPTPTQHFTSDIGIAVAYFAISDPSIEVNRADALVLRFSQLLDQQLTSSIDRMHITYQLLGPDIIGRIEGENPRSRLSSAQLIAQQRDAAIVVYGEVTKGTSGQLQITPEFYVSPYSFDSAFEVTGRHRLGTGIAVENDVSTQQQLTIRTRALSYIVRGLGYYVSNEYDNALTAFRQVQSLDEWSQMDGREVLHILLGNVYLRLVDRDAFACDRSAVMEDVSEALQQFYRAESLANDPYARPYSGLAAAYLVRARWILEENDQCEDENYQFASLNSSLYYISVAETVEAEESIDTSPLVTARLRLNEARITTLVCTIPGFFATEEEHIENCERAQNAAHQVISLYEDRGNPSLGAQAAQAYGFLGDLELYLHEDFNTAIERYDAALEIETIYPETRMLLTRYKADAYYHLGRFDRASEFYEEARQVAVELGYERNAALYEALRDQATRNAR